MVMMAEAAAAEGLSMLTVPIAQAETQRKGHAMGGRWTWEVGVGGGR